MTSTSSTELSNPELLATVGQIAAIISESSYAVGMTGAGMSVESGIPPFRGADGLWTKHGTPQMDGYASFKKDPTGWWNRRTNRKIDAHINELRDALVKAEPHAGHHALAALEKQGSLQSLVTQNIDALDEKAGVENLVEIHGNRTKLRCIECGDRVSLGDFGPLFAPDPCNKCGGVVKFDTVMFGEPIPDDVMTAARAEIDKADCVLAIGTSATVRPASGLLWIAQSAGATIIEINPTETKLTPICEVSLRSTAGVALPLLLETLSP
ncbi:MAG: Sir2 family NAD-dependent protein deacetylase [Dehalococcoidia bacterium]|mgnify:CR=1 FL=1|jgi:NAD-dependent deacetylase|nr:NAD-dependent protein deacylase [Chloroflexota bacterium]MDP6055408.1 Sir2 family NAD-dependent protein deacetylase [Dehalococcoidia bacterium]MDP7484615.1 Sir2 family NAD-dependent protein deacetylase [Dehalococcoidia bacterium]|tara:strand:+ start:1428 stop:2231 length:804 start_codon:yes stop_codon:yes gene_type:complete